MVERVTHQSNHMISYLSHKYKQDYDGNSILLLVNLSLTGTGPDGTVTISSANGLVGTAFASR